MRGKACTNLLTVIMIVFIVFSFFFVLEWKKGEEMGEVELSEDWNWILFNNNNNNSKKKVSLNNFSSSLCSNFIYLKIYKPELIFFSLSHCLSLCCNSGLSLSLSLSVFNASSVRTVNFLLGQLFKLIDHFHIHLLTSDISYLIIKVYGISEKKIHLQIQGIN